MLQVASYSTYRALNEKYFGKMIGEAPEGTIQEVRRFSGSCSGGFPEMLELCKNGLAYYLNNETLGIWRLLDPVIKTLSSQGIEKVASSRGGEVDRKRKDRDTSPKNRSPLTRRNPGPPKKTCLVCKKKHLPLRSLPDGFRKKMKEEANAKKAATATFLSEPSPSISLNPTIFCSPWRLIHSTQLTGVFNRSSNRIDPWMHNLNFSLVLGQKGPKACSPGPTLLL